MISKILTRLFGSKHERFIKRVAPLVKKINDEFSTLNRLSDEELRAKTALFKERIAKGESTDDILPEAFAVVKEACRRHVGKEWRVVNHNIRWEMVPYDVQLIGGIALHQGKIAEMATGEGKTLVAVMPTYLNALTGRGVHVVTVNDYLAQRDSEWMGQIHRFLGLSVGVILNNMSSDTRRKNYACDITYGTNNEFGFDYLRDNMAVDIDDLVQRPFYYAIVDEVDSVLVDEARTPLIISGTINVTMESYNQLSPLVKKLYERQNHFNNELIAEAKALLAKEAVTEEIRLQAGEKLFQAKLGGPKHKQLMKIFNETGMKALCEQAENYYIREKRTHELEEKNFFNINEKNHSADLTEKGREILAGNQGDKDLFLLPDLSDELVKISNDVKISEIDKLKAKEEIHKKHQDRSERIHVISQLLRAYSLYEKDVEYMVQDDRIIIIDEHTGRPLEGRRYSDGLHQAIEAKEGVKVQRESQTLASVTLQNYFRMYEKLAGMTGTAETEENEFWEIYKLEVVVIPTNDSIRRADYDDMVYKTRKEKYKALIAKIKELNDIGRPVLVGTISVEVSEFIAAMLKRQGVRCQVLNARHHEREAEIVTQAGQFGAVTIATNMAGRGTDIKLGSGVVKYVNGDGVKNGAEGGLFVIGTERHESRRIDRQLRGRAGRQGDPGASLFYLSLEDDLMRLFGSDRIARIMDRLGMKEDEPIIHPWITKSVERAQKRVEARNFEIRKHLLEYDNVMNIMRTEIYKRRKAALTGENIDSVMRETIEGYLEDVLFQYCGENVPSSEWDWDGLNGELLSVLSITVDEQHNLSLEEMLDLLVNKAEEYLAERKKFVDSIDNNLFDKIRRIHILRTIDDLWKDHLYDMDCLREGINFQAYGQKDPLVEYKKEGFRMFEALLSKVQRSSLEKIYNTTFTVEEKRGTQSLVNVRFSKAEASNAIRDHGTNRSTGNDSESSAESRAHAQNHGPQRPVIAPPKVGPNDPCPCGSGKKFKKCHG